MRNVVGVVNLHDGPNLGVLTESRPLGTVTFLGRYGLMDFALSNLSNSGIDRIGMLVENNVQAVRTHLGQGSIWINNTITGFLRYFSNEKLINNPNFNTDVANIRANYHQLEGLDADYVVVTNPFMIMSIDLQEVVEQHIASGNDCTIIYTNTKRADRDYPNCEELEIDENSGELIGILPLKEGKKAANVSLQTYVFNRAVFEDLVRAGKEISSFYNIRQMVTYLTNHGKMNTGVFEFEGYVAPILSLEAYIRYSFDLLSYKTRCRLFKDEWPIYTTTHNTPPTLYGPESKVENSFIANGAIVKGKVTNSIISRGVIVEEGANVDNCILFTGTRVGDDITIKYVLADKDVVISEKKRIVGDEDNIVTIGMRAKI